ncbi:membrane protein [Salmonella enterica subsp. enterica]|uniref:Membrane protein n=1 Tax=Salmonella enterica I TaxID=59201 RepID=A0A379VR42_SALET|nr:membrane protein [Salmonella enterica subsp. enterica]
MYQATSNPIYKEVTVKVPTGNTKRFLGFIDIEEKIRKKEVVQEGWSDCQVDGERLNEDITRTVDKLNQDGFEVISITPVTSGNWGFKYDSGSINNGTGRGGLWLRIWLLLYRRCFNPHKGKRELIKYGVIPKNFRGFKSKLLYSPFHFLAAIISTFFIYISMQNPSGMKGGQCNILCYHALLYPYARFVYEQVVSFIMGENVFFINAIVMLMAKVITMCLCWIFSIFIAPVGLAYLYYYHSRGD